MSWENSPGDKGRIPEQGVEELTEKDSNKSKKGKKGLGTGRGKGKWKGLLILALVGFVIYMLLDGGVGITKVRWTFNSTPDENLESLFKGIKDVEKVNKKQGQSYDDVYDKNNIYEDKSAFKMVDKEYIIYVYTGDKGVDKDFNDWVKMNQGLYPVYKLNRSNLSTQEAMIEYTTAERKPLIYIMKEVDKGYKVIEAVVSDAEGLKGIARVMDDIIEERTVKKSGE